MKKLIIILTAIIYTVTWMHAYAAQSTPDPEWQQNPETNRYDAWNEWFWKSTKKKVSWINTISTKTVDASNWHKILDTLQTAINWILWMLSFIALILCLRWGFQMLTAAGDDNKVKTWTKILKNAAIGLAVIWLSWLVVSFVFRIINKVTNNTA